MCLFKWTILFSGGFSLKMVCLGSSLPLPPALVALITRTRIRHPNHVRVTATGVRPRGQEHTVSSSLGPGLYEELMRLRAVTGPLRNLWTNLGSEERNKLEEPTQCLVAHRSAGRRLVQFLLKVGQLPVGAALHWRDFKVVKRAALPT